MLHKNYIVSIMDLFEGFDTSNMRPCDYIGIKKLYNYIVESADIAEQEKVSIDDVLDEGILTGLLGGIAGYTLGPAIGKAICKVLKIDEKGVLGSLICSKLVLAGIGSELGFKM